VESKKKSGKNIRLFLVDTNLFIAAVKNPKKETVSLKLLLELIDDATIVLIGNEFLIMEMEKYAQVFESILAWAK
jgi:CRISPR/Cas system CSM-associated protein Csm2 small subunit